MYKGLNRIVNQAVFLKISLFNDEEKCKNQKN